MMMRRVAATVAALLLTVANPALARDKLTVLLDWFVNPGHATLVVAEEIGAFAAEDLDVELVPPADSTLPPKLVAAGHGDLAIDQQPQFYQQIDQGLPLVRVGVLIDQPLTTLVALRENGITQVADLKGRRLGYGSGDMDLALAAAVLASAHLSLTDVKVVEVGDQLSAALLTHQVDAVNVYRNFELHELRAKGVTPIGFNVEEFGVPAYDEMILVAGRDHAHDPRLPRFLRALATAAAYVHAHPDESWTLFLRHHPDLDDETNKAAWAATLPTLATQPTAFSAVRYRAFGAFLVAAKLIKANPEPASLVP